MRNAGEANITNQDVALSLVRAGFYVFPCDQNKRPLIAAWRENSTTDVHTVHQMWMGQRGALVAVDCGKSGLFVVDCDRRQGKPDGVKQFSNLCVQHRQPLTDLFTVSTMSGGLHVYFRQNGEPLGNSVGKLAPSVDTRGVGGYCIAPGTQTVNCVRYKPNKLTMEITSLVPPWIAAMLRSRAIAIATAKAANNYNNSLIGNEREQAYADATLHRIAAELSATAPGSRNELLNRAAFRLGTMSARRWISSHKIIMTLTMAAENCGLVKDDGAYAVAKTLRSGLSAGERSPCNDLSPRICSTKPPTISG
jgi:hypothetical protein